MAHFPQLTTGASAQYPLVKRVRTRTIINQAEDGNVLKLDDPDFTLIEWELPMEGLTDQEWSEVETLFQSCEGRLRTFHFLDPSDNLLAWSEDFSAGVWAKDPLLQLTPGVSDPFGGGGATRVTNIGQSHQRITQAIDGPANFHYCLSLWVRSQQWTEISMLRFSASRAESVIQRVSPTWQRVSASANLRVAENPIHLGFELRAGESVEVFGAQVEAQPGASGYRKTTGRGGVYANARFLNDSLTLTTDGSNQHSSVIRITAGLKG